MVTFIQRHQKVQQTEHIAQFFNVYNLPGHEASKKKNTIKPFNVKPELYLCQFSQVTNANEKEKWNKLCKTH